MNPMDCKQAQNVWSRVMAAQTAALCTNAEKAPEKTARAQQAPAVSITPEQVMQAMFRALAMHFEFSLDGIATPQTTEK